MAIPGLGDIIEVVMTHKHNNIDDVINVWHLKVAVAGSGTELQLSADLIDMFTDIYAVIEADICTTIDPVQLSWRNVTDDGPMNFQAWSGTYTGGTNSGDCLPPGATALMLLRTGTKGVLGRKYLPPFGESRQADGVWGAATITNLGTLAGLLDNQFSLPLTSLEVVFVVWSRTQGQAFNVSSAQGQPLVAYQRRRRPGRGS